MFIQRMMRAAAGTNAGYYVIPRSFTISPAVSGETTWDLDVDGPLTITTAGTWTITPRAPLTVHVELNGGGGGSGGWGHTAGWGGAGGPSQFNGMNAGGGSGGGIGTASGSGPGGAGGTASGGDTNLNGSGRTSPNGDGYGTGGAAVGPFSGTYTGPGGGGAYCETLAMPLQSGTAYALKVGAAGSGGSPDQLSGNAGVCGRAIIA